LSPFAHISQDEATVYPYAQENSAQASSFPRACKQTFSAFPFPRTRAIDSCQLSKGRKTETTTNFHTSI